MADIVDSNLQEEQYLKKEIESLQNQFELLRPSNLSSDEVYKGDPKALWETIKVTHEKNHELSLEIENLKWILSNINGYRDLSVQDLQDKIDQLKLAIDDPDYDDGQMPPPEPFDEWIEMPPPQPFDEWIEMPPPQPFDEWIEMRYPDDQSDFHDEMSRDSTEPRYSEAFFIQAQQLL